MCIKRWMMFKIALIFIVSCFFAVDIFAENQVSTIDELVERYLTARKSLSRIVLPFDDKIQSEWDYSEKQEWAFLTSPAWYCTFSEGPFYFEKGSDISRTVKSQASIMIYEDIIANEVVAFVFEGEKQTSEFIYDAPLWFADASKSRNEDEFIREVSERRIVWYVTVKSATLPVPEFIQSIPVSMAMRSGVPDFAITNVGRVSSGIQIAFPCSTDSYYRVGCSTSLVQSSTWGLTNMLLGVSGGQSWADSFSTNLLYQFYRVDEIAVTNAGDADADGLDDVWELIYSLNPLNPSDVNADDDSDGLTSFQEYCGNTRPDTSDSNTNGIIDGWDVYSGSLPKGDINGDGVASSTDLAVLDSILLESSYDITPVTFAQADFNQDGLLDQIDRAALADLLDGKPMIFVLKPVKK